MKQCMTYMSPHHEHEHQCNVNNCWFCILSNHGITQIFEFITELLTAFIGKNITYYRNNTDSNISNFTHCKTCKMRLLAIEYTILTRYYYQTSKRRALYESLDGPAGWPADNPPNWDGLGDFHRTVPEWMVRVYFQLPTPIWQWFGFYPDPDPNRRSGTVATSSITYQHCEFQLILSHYQYCYKPQFNCSPHPHSHHHHHHHSHHHGSHYNHRY